MAEQYKASEAVISAFEKTLADDSAECSPLDAAVNAAILELQTRAEHLGVKAARQHSWCGVFNGLMWDIFPNGPIDGSDWRDAAGISCDGEKWRDAEGYDRDGFNSAGRNKEGFDVEGRDIHGFDKEGLDIEGKHRSDPARYKYDREGLDRDGFDKDGYVYRGLTRQTLNEWRADPARYKYDRFGFDIEGFTRQGRDKDGYDRAGFDRSGWSRDGINVRGFNRDGVYVETGGRVDPDGFDFEGYWVSPNGYRTWSNPDGWSQEDMFQRRRLEAEKAKQVSTTASVTA